MPMAPWSEVWSLRLAEPGTPEHRRWSIGLYARLELVSRSVFAMAFPRTDRALRETAWTGLWVRWSERPPTPRRALGDDDDIARYVTRSLVNAMRSQLRRRAARARLHAEREWDMKLVVHTGVVDDDTLDPIERDQQVTAARRSLAFFRSDQFEAMWSSRRAGRAAEVMRLAAERIAIAGGERSFDDVVVAEMLPGEARRVVENRLRQRYLRAMRDILAAIDRHEPQLVRAGHDPAMLRLCTLQLFSDRSVVRPRQRTLGAPR